MRATTIVLVDDHEILLATLQSWLGSVENLRVVGVARLAEDAIPLVRSEKPDVIVFDVDMPGRSPFDVAKLIRGISPNTKLMFLSAFYSDLYIERALDCGASAYVTKGESPSMLLDAIARVGQGESFFSPRVRERLIVEPNGGVRTAGTGKTRLSTLSDREREVLQLVARGLTGKEVASTLHLSPKTVDNHTQRIMEKLDLHGRAELIRFAIREGCVQP